MIFAFSPSSPVQGSPNIEAIDEQLDGSYAGAYLLTSGWQNFTPSETNVAKIGVRMTAYGTPTGNVNLYYNDEPNTNTPLGSCSVNVDYDTSPTGQWFECDITDVAVGSESYIYVESTSGNKKWTYSSGANRYDYGNASINLAWDFHFRSYYETTFVVPEFGNTLPFLIISLFVFLGVLMTKKRQKFGKTKK
jgi:hypothetical protein